MRIPPASTLLSTGRTRLLALVAAVAWTVLTPAAHAQCPASFAPAVNYASSGAPIAVAVGDFNADGKLDTQILNGLSNTVRCYLNTGTGSFTTTGEVSVGTSPSSIAVGDFNGDGRPDFVTSNFGSNNVSVRLGIGNGFTSAAVNYPAGTNPRFVAIGDFNGDGRADLAVANQHSFNVSVLLGNGNGTFGATVNYGTMLQPCAVVVEDFNADGRADLAVANSQGFNVSVLLGNGNGTFGAVTNFAVGPNPESMAVGDFNGDGRPDLAVANRSISSVIGGSVSVLLGNGNGTFAAAVNYALNAQPRSIAVGDINIDGRADLLVANATFGSAHLAVLMGNGNGTFAAPFVMGAALLPISVTLGDFNGDRRPDLVTASEGNSCMWVLLNNSAANPLPVFALQPNGRVVQTGEGVSFTAAANFFGGPTAYQWRRNGQPLSNGGNISGANTATLTISPASASDMASYDVQAISGECNGVQSSSTSSAAVLAVTNSNANCLAADIGVQGGIAGRDNLLDNNDFIVFIDNFFNQTQCP